MQAQEQHGMVIAQTYPSGAEEWYCPTCGYRFLMQWPPQFKKIMLDQGDPTAIHSGGNGGIRLELTDVTNNATSSPDQAAESHDHPGSEIDAERLEAWMDFIDEIDIPGELDKDQPE